MSTKKTSGDTISARRPAWPADRVARMPVASLVPYERNSRTHSPEQVAQIAASIAAWGFTMPVLVDAQGVLIAGHGRLLAAQRLGLTDVPAMVADGWSEAQIRAYRIADNKLTLNAGWDADALKFEFGELQDLGFELGLTGFGEAELMGLLGSTPGLTDPDDAPEPPAEPVTQPGDVWLLGRHRLVCGDATKAEDVARCLNGVAPHLMVTDPPYGVEYDANWRNHAGSLGYKQPTMGTGGRAIGKVGNDDRADWKDAWSLFPGDVAYVWHASLFGALIADGLTEVGFDLRSQIIWAKPRFVISRGNYHWQHETCWYAVRNKGHWTGDRSQSTLWSIDHQKSETGHSTQKPVECMRRPIANNSSPGQAVYDCFGGSATTLIACEMTGRVCHMLEIAPQYVDVGVLRWQAFVGKDATLEETGETYGAVKARRVPATAPAISPADAV